MRRHKRNGVVGQVMPYARRAKKSAVKAQKKAGPAVEQAWDRVAPAVESAKERLAPAVEEAREKAEAAVVTAMEASEPYRQEAMKRGTAAWLALRGELEAPAPKKNRHWVRNILLIGGIGGSAYLAYKILRNGTASEWMPKRSDTSESSESETEDRQPASSATSATTGAGPTGKHKDDEATPVNGPAKNADKPTATTGSRATANRTPHSATGKDSSTS